MSVSTISTTVPEVCTILLHGLNGTYLKVLKFVVCLNVKYIFLFYSTVSQQCFGVGGHSERI